jgi:hypothetical protein
MMRRLATEVGSWRCGLIRGAAEPKVARRAETLEWRWPPERYPAHGTWWRLGARLGEPLRMRTPLSRRTGLRSKPGRGFCQYLALFRQHAVPPAQPIELFAFTRGRAVAAQTFIQRGLFGPLTDVLGRGIELARQLVDAAAGARQFDESPSVFRRIWLMCS